MDPRITDTLLMEAARLAESGEIPREVYQAYRSHLGSARRRGISFLFTVREWWEWWQIDGRWANRGRGKDKFVMGRNGDVGPYSLENVYCTTHSGNVRDIDPQRRSETIKAGYARFKAAGKIHHLAVRGDGHPSSRAVLTPAGRFGSAALAGDHFKITRQHAGKKAREHLDGWRYEDERPSAQSDPQPRRKFPYVR